MPIFIVPLLSILAQSEAAASTELLSPCWLPELPSEAEALEPDWLDWS